MSEAVELEPCPFCGGEAKVITPANSAPYGLCLRCHAGGPVNSTATPDEAVTAWNRRALNPGEGEPVAQDAKDAEITRLRSLLAEAGQVVESLVEYVDWYFADDVLFRTGPGREEILPSARSLSTKLKGEGQ